MAFVAVLLLVQAAVAQTSSVQDLLQENRAQVEKGSRKTLGPAISALIASGLPQTQTVLQKWQAKEMSQRDSDGLFFYGDEIATKTYRLLDFDTGEPVGDCPLSDLNQLKPNSGVRALLGVALVQFQLSDPNPDRRREALLSIERDPEASQLEPLRASIDAEDDAEIRALKDNLLQLLTISYDADEKSRIEAIQRLSGSIALDVRSALNPLVATKRHAVLGPVSNEINVAKISEAGSSEISKDAAYELLVQPGHALPKISEAAKLAA